MRRVVVGGAVCCCAGTLLGCALVWVALMYGGDSVVSW